MKLILSSNAPVDRDYLKCRKMEKIMEKIGSGKWERILIYCRDDSDLGQGIENQSVRVGSGQGTAYHQLECT